MQNRSAVLTAATQLAVVDSPVPVPGPHQVLVQVDAVGICGSDVHYYEHGRIGSFVVDQPTIIGHEAAGVIVAIGEDVTDRAVKVDELITHRFTIDHTEDALTIGRRNPNSLKAIVHPQESRTD